MLKCGLCCGLVSACLSVMFVHSVQRAEDIINLLCWPSNLITLYFLNFSAQFQGESLQRGRGKIGDFRLKLPYISEMVRDRPMVTM